MRVGGAVAIPSTRFQQNMKLWLIPKCDARNACTASFHPIGEQWNTIMRLVCDTERRLDERKHTQLHLIVPLVGR